MGLGCPPLRGNVLVLIIAVIVAVAVVIIAVVGGGGGSGGGVPVCVYGYMCAEGGIGMRVRTAVTFLGAFNAVCTVSGRPPRSGNVEG